MESVYVCTYCTFVCMYIILYVGDARLKPFTQNVYSATMWSLYLITSCRIFCVCVCFTRLLLKTIQKPGSQINIKLLTSVKKTQLFLMMAGDALLLQLWWCHVTNGL